MPVRIKSVSVKDLGPVSRLDFDFGLINLIYSPNEKGKTFLTEFIIRSLFGRVERWSTLRKGGNGKVIVSGLENEKSNVEFSPVSKKKLEDYWQEQQKGMPVSPAKLLVVKGGEAGIDEGIGGIGRYIIREVLSGLNILDKIDSEQNISKTVKAAKIENGHLIIPNQGEGKKYASIRERLEKLNRIFSKVEEQYALGVLKSHRQELKLLEDRLSNLDDSKKHLAWKLDSQTAKYREELSKAPENRISDIKNRINLYLNKLDNFNSDKQAFETTCKDCQDYRWLEKAFSIYKNLLFSLNANSAKPAGGFAKKVIIPVAILTALAACFVITGFIIPLSFLLWTGLFFFVAAGIFSVIALKKSSSRDSSENLQPQELENIKNEFKKRFNRDLSDIALLEEILEEQKKNFNLSISLESRMNQAGKDLEMALSSILKDASLLSGRKIYSANEASEILNRLEIANSGLEKKISESEKRLYLLGVDRSDYIQSPARDLTEFSAENYEKTKNLLEDLENIISKQEQELEFLKHDVCSMTGDDYSIGWDELIESLRIKIIESQYELSEIASQIAAGVVVHDVIEELRQQEDIKIRQGLESEKVLGPLKDITKRYNRLQLEGEKLLVSDSYNDFDLNELSTGAREQIMLALRIGFTKSLLGNDSLFLLLDDAFQHSDWNKRELLINKLAEIASTGWQIIYFTMDDHIRDLFSRITSKNTDLDYRYMNL
jgi:uncharacterized protein YhaN